MSVPLTDFIYLLNMLERGVGAKTNATRYRVWTKIAHVVNARYFLAQLRLEMGTHAYFTVNYLFAEYDPYTNALEVRLYGWYDDHPWNYTVAERS